MKDVFIVSAVRTAVGRQRGYFREYMAPELLARVLDESVDRIKLDATEVDDVITGCVYQIGEQGFNWHAWRCWPQSFLRPSAESP